LFWKSLPPGVHKRILPTLQRSINPIKDERVIRDLRKTFQEFKPDVVHLHSSKMAFLGRLSFPSAIIIYTVHGFDSIRIAFRKFLSLERILQYRARFIVAVSRYDHKNLNEEGITRNVSFIYNGIADFPSLPTSEEENTIFRDAKTAIQKSTRFNVLCIARMAAPKRFDLFCDTAKLLEEHQVNFFWVGNKQPVTDTPPNVYCLGEVPNAHRLLPHVNLFLLPSDYEGMPMSILEALSYSIPVVASDVGGIGEVLDNTNGFAVKNSPEIFANHILQYKSDSVRYEQAKANARLSYKDNFTVEKMYQSYKKLYNTITFAAG
ncbi:MAG TPA: glycosyltransferase, partial [Dyadobacter sp.]|nr:glycosyltransferase [Dyadobacter sp.]